jgi:chromosome segregation ATPase
LLEEGSKKIRADLEKVYTNWKTTKDLFDKEKKKKDAAISLGAPPSFTDRQNYKLKLDELRNQSSAALRKLTDMLKQLENIENKTQSMSIDLKQLGDDKNKMYNLLGSTQLSSYDAHIDLNDSLQKINKSNLGKKGKKEIEELITAFDEKDNRIDNQDAELQLIEDELIRLNKFLVKISGKNVESKSACEQMQSEIQNELNSLIWM